MLRKHLAALRFKIININIEYNNTCILKILNYIWADQLNDNTLHWTKDQISKIVSMTGLRRLILNCWGNSQFSMYVHLS